MITAGAVLLALAGCAPDPNETSVELYHCGIEPLKFEGRFWEVPEPPPFDQTNAPDEWVGRGVLTTTTTDKLTYRDRSGIILEFVPGDGVNPDGCA